MAGREAIVSVDGLIGHPCTDLAREWLHARGLAGAAGAWSA